MDISLIKTGDVFYYEDYITFMNKTHRYKCKVLFVGEDNIFYDTWRDSINKWTFIPVAKRLAYYKFPLTHLHRITFDGFEEINKKNMEKLFVNSPEIILRASKNEFINKQIYDGLIDLHTEQFYFVPTGPKGGWLKPIKVDCKGLTIPLLIDKVLENQNLDFIQSENVIIDRIGLYAGIPSYQIRTY